MKLNELIVNICGIMSISGNETDSGSTEELNRLIGGVFDESYVDALGNHFFVRHCHKPNPPKILIDTHFDEIGMMVTDISKEGFLSVINIGGVDTRILPGLEVLVYGKKTIYGVVSSYTPAAGEEGKLRPIERLRVDTGYSYDELTGLCPIGTYVGFRPVYGTLGENRLYGKAFDDKACAACAVYGIDAVDTDDLAGDIYFCLSSFEETGMAGARVTGYGVDPDLALVMDVTHAKIPDCAGHTLSPMDSGVSVTVGPRVNRRLSLASLELLEKKGIPCVVEPASGGTGTNANVLNFAGRGIPTALFSLPIKNMHSACEVLSMADATALANAVSVFISSTETVESVTGPASAGTR